ncbi:DUF952 domain-containing protein [Hyphomonas atlantica]|jgi:uncharacterized protein (DUF952 family)|uniref:DUF952 domain-containing protein n=2 Tax=Hyphomonadaceae TaxID=69657 RepID=UPI00351856DF
MARMDDAYVYKLLTDDQWRAAEASGVTDVPLDREDGYVHLSTVKQVGETAAKYFSGLQNVRLVRFPVDRLPPLQWETSRGGQLFPHLYTRLQIAKADAVWRLACGTDGAPVMPEELNHEPD